MSLPPEGEGQGIAQSFSREANLKRCGRNAGFMVGFKMVILERRTKNPSKALLRATQNLFLSLYFSLLLHQNLSERAGGQQGKY